MSIIKLNQKDTHRLIRSCYPPTGILDAVVHPDDLEIIFALEGWTNDRITAELGNLYFLPKEDWVMGVPSATIIMASFCYPSSGRFHDNNVGAWYASFKLGTAIAEIIHHLKIEMQEVQQFTYVQFREYLADFNDEYYDSRTEDWMNLEIYNSESYFESQKFAKNLRDNNVNGILYNSVRDKGSHCIVCFKPKKILNVRQSRHFEIAWDGYNEATVKQLAV